MGYTGTLEEIIEQFCAENWGMTKGETTAMRFKGEIEWFRGMVREYAEVFGKTPDEMAAELEAQRDYSWPNYYQPAHFPSLKDAKNSPYFVGRFATPKDFEAYVKENIVGYRCPNCGNIGRDPQRCEHRKAEDGVCDWCAYGLFESQWFILIPSIRYAKIPIFEPVLKSVKLKV